jgi:hypothetical protein
MRSGMTLLQENLGMFLSRMFERHVIPLILETMKEEELISIVGSPKDLKELDEHYITYITNKTIINSLAKGEGFPKPEFLEHTKEMIKEGLGDFEKIRYLDIKREFLKRWSYEVEVFVTGESFNKAVMVQQLNEMLINYSRIPGVNIDIDAIFKEILDLMGISGARFLKTPEEVRAMAPVQEPPSLQRARPETEMVAESATGERRGAGMSATL